MSVHEQVRRVVVAFTAGEAGAAAVEAAGREAAHTNARVDVLHVVDLRGVSGGDAADGDDERGAAHRLLERVPGLIPSGVRFTCQLLVGDAGAEIVAFARQAQLLVVGRTTREAPGGLVLGSVTVHCILHAGCPVLVVPSHRASHLTGPLELGESWSA